MPFCCTSKMLRDTLEYLAPYGKPPETLEACLRDRLASMMLLKYAETEHSAENVSFLLEVHELNMFVKLKSRLRRAITRVTGMTRRTGSEGLRRTDGPMRATDARRSVRSSDRCSRATDRRTRADGMSTQSSERAIDLTRSIIKKHVANNNLCLTENIGGALRRWLRDTEAPPLVPHDLISAAYKMTLRTVEQDIWPRFRKSAHYEELLCLHLGRTLQHEAFRKAFEAELTPPQSDALAFWQDASTLDVDASAPDALAKVQLATASIFARHRDCLHAICPDEVEAIRATIFGASEASVTVFNGALSAALNTLTDPYVAYLSADKSRPLLAELGVNGDHSFARNASANAGSAAPVPMDDAAPVDDDWAAGW